MKRCLKFESLVDTLITGVCKESNVDHVVRFPHPETGSYIEITWDVAFKDESSRDAFIDEMSNVFNERGLSKLVDVKSCDESDTYNDTYFAVISFVFEEDGSFEELNRLVVRNNDIQLNETTWIGQAFRRIKYAGIF